MNDTFFMKKALEQACNAFEAGDFPVGCVITYQSDIVATGRRSGTTGGHVNETDHAEMVALQRLNHTGRDIDRSKAVIYCTMEPCLMCFGAILLSGIGKIVYAYEDVMGGATSCNRTDMAPLYANNPISIVPGVMRGDSLQLFKRYFHRSGNAYWPDSLLARYTIDQLL